MKKEMTLGQLVAYWLKVEHQYQDIEKQATKWNRDDVAESAHTRRAIAMDMTARFLRQQAEVDLDLWEERRLLTRLKNKLPLYEEQRKKPKKAKEN